MHDPSTTARLSTSPKDPSETTDRVTGPGTFLDLCSYCAAELERESPERIVRVTPIDAPAPPPIDPQLTLGAI